MGRTVPFEARPRRSIIPVLFKASYRSRVEADLALRRKGSASEISLVVSWRAELGG